MRINRTARRSVQRAPKPKTHMPLPSNTHRIHASARWLPFHLGAETQTTTTFSNYSQSSVCQGAHGARRQLLLYRHACKHTRRHVRTARAIIDRDMLPQQSKNTTRIDKKPQHTQKASRFQTMSGRNAQFCPHAERRRRVRWLICACSTPCIDRCDFQLSHSLGVRGFLCVFFVCIRRQ